MKSTSYSIKLIFLIISLTTSLLANKYEQKNTYNMRYLPVANNNTDSDNNKNSIENNIRKEYSNIQNIEVYTNGPNVEVETKIETASTTTVTPTEVKVQTPVQNDQTSKDEKVKLTDTSNLEETSNVTVDITSSETNNINNNTKTEQSKNDSSAERAKKLKLFWAIGGSVLIIIALILIIFCIFRSVRKVPDDDLKPLFKNENTK